MLVKIERVHAGTMRYGTYEEAQIRECAFWRWVAFEGYAGADPRVFPSFQALAMLTTYMRTRWPLDTFQDATIIEIGCGPLGMIECIPGAKRIAYDPLNAHYGKLFGKCRSG